MNKDLRDKCIDNLVDDMQDLQKFRKAWRELPPKAQQETKRNWGEIIRRTYDQWHLDQSRQP